MIHDAFSLQIFTIKEENFRNTQITKATNKFSAQLEKLGEVLPLLSNEILIRKWKMLRENGLEICINYGWKKKEADIIKLFRISLERRQDQYY